MPSRQLPAGLLSLIFIFLFILKFYRLKTSIYTMNMRIRTTSLSASSLDNWFAPKLGPFSEQWKNTV